jgi:hypothetical protein
MANPRNARLSCATEIFRSVSSAARILTIDQQRFGGRNLHLRVVRVPFSGEREQPRRLVEASALPLNHRLIVRPASSSRSVSAESPLRMPTPPAYARIPACHHVRRLRKNNRPRTPTPVDAMRHPASRRSVERQGDGFDRHDDDEHVARPDAPLFVVDDGRPNPGNALNRPVRRGPRLHRQHRRKSQPRAA